MVKILLSNTGDMHSIPGRETKNPYAVQHGQRIKKKKVKLNFKKEVARDIRDKQMQYDEGGGMSQSGGQAEEVAV